MSRAGQGAVADAGGADEGPRLGWFHRAFDRLYPLIRFFHERVRGNAWFSEIAPRLWLGGAPDTPGDYAFLLDHGIDAVLDIRAEREDDTVWYRRHGVRYLHVGVLDLGVPDEATIERAVSWIAAQVADGRTVLVHCAKGRGRSATLLAAYLMAARGLSFYEARALLLSRRRLTRLEERHRRVLAAWWAARRPAPSVQVTGTTEAATMEPHGAPASGGEGEDDHGGQQSLAHA